MLSIVDERLGTLIACEYLDTAERYLLDGETERGLNLICECLRRVRSVLEPGEWDEYIRDICLAHPVAELLYQDPLTFRAYHKPRGYPGDAVTIDYIYGREDERLAPQRSSEIGRQIYNQGCMRPAPTAVRERRHIVAELIDVLALRVQRPRILSLAAGHLREADLSSALRGGAVGELVALDQDPKSVAVIEKEYSRYSVTPVCSDVRAVMNDAEPLGQFDFVYATGLFDYLRPQMASRLVNRMLTMTRPGGQVLVPNFVPNIPDLGYLEAFMGWKLIYRDEDDLRALFGEKDLANHDLFLGANHNIAYILVRKS